MRKSLFIILMVCLALVGLVSCKNEIEPVQEELIYVSFENGTSRALTATLEDFDVKDYYWSYEAKKNDGSGLKSGQTDWDEDGTGSVAVQTGKGLNYDGTVNPVKVPGFSKGYWNFRLFAYTDADRTKLAYWGEVDSVLIDSSHHLASVTVSPVAGANGYLKIGTITFNPASTISVPTDLVIYTDELFKLVDNEWVKDETQPVEGVYTLLAGQYKFTRTYSFDGIPVANGSVIVTIYSNLTTTVSGSLSELTTYAEFEGKQNPDIVRETWGSDIVTESTAPTATVDFAKNLDPSATSKVIEASMPAAAAVAKLEELKEAVGADDNTSSTLKLNLSVDTTDVRQQSVTYDIGMEAVLTYTKNAQKTSAKSDVKNVTDYVLIDIDLTSDIAGVTVTHSGEDMILTDDMEKAGDPAYASQAKYKDINKGTKDDPLWVGFYMLETTGDGQVLHLKTKSFSPFEVTYQMTKYVAAIGNVKYTTLAAAVDAATAGQTIFLLEDIDLADQVVVNKKVSLDLNGKRIYNTVDLWDKVPGSWSLISVQEGGALTITGNGTIDAKANDCYAIDVRGGATLVVESGTFTGNVSTIYAHDGFVTVKGGTFNLKQLYPDYRFMLNCLDASYASDPATAGFTVSGGKFKGFNPGNNLSEGADTNYLAAGYGAKALEDDWYEVVPFDVLNTTTGAGYYLAKEGTNKGKLVDGTGTVITPTPAKTDKLVLLDSKLANIVDDSIDNFHAGYSWAAIHSDAEDDRRNKYFGAGWGTKIEPYAISNYDRLCNVNWPFEGTTETDLYFELTADIDVKAHDSEQWAHSFLYNDPTYYHINMRNHSLTIGNKYLFGYAVKLEMCNGSIVFDGAASVVDYACYQDVSSYEMYFHDLTLSGTVETSNAHYGLLVSYAFGINSGSAAFNASNIVNNVSIFNNNSTAYTGGLFGYVQGSAASSSVTDCTFNGSIVSAYAGGFLNPCSFPNGDVSKVTSTGNILNGSLLASTTAIAFGATTTGLQKTVSLGDSASIVVIPESTDLISVDGDDQVILSRKDNVATYRVAIVFSVHSTEDGKGGYPRYITVDFDQIEDETKATGIYKYEIEQSESDESEGKTVVTDAGSYKIWLDGETYYVYCPDYEIDKTPLDKTRATIWAYGYDADSKMIAYQKIIYTF